MLDGDTTFAHTADAQIYNSVEDNAVTVLEQGEKKGVGYGESAGYLAQFDLSQHPSSKNLQVALSAGLLGVAPTESSQNDLSRYGLRIKAKVEGPGGPYKGYFRIAFSQTTSEPLVILKSEPVEFTSEWQEFDLQNLKFDGEFLDTMISGYRFVGFRMLLTNAGEMTGLTDPISLHFDDVCFYLKE